MSLAQSWTINGGERFHSRGKSDSLLLHSFSGSSRVVERGCIDVKAIRCARIGSLLHLLGPVTANPIHNLGCGVVLSHDSNSLRNRDHPPPTLVALSDHRGAEQNRQRPGIGTWYTIKSLEAAGSGNETFPFLFPRGNLIDLSVQMSRFI